jgi:hypothetical protein
MNINLTLINELRSCFQPYDWGFHDVERFLLNYHQAGQFTERQTLAIEIIRNIMTQHGKSMLADSIVKLAEIELKIRELQPGRDHVVHAVLTFALGVLLNEKALNVIGFKSAKPFEWELAGLFHDISYPPEIASSILNDFDKNIFDIKESIEPDFSTTHVRFKILPTNLDKLVNGNSINLIQKQLNDWQLKIDARREYRRLINNRSGCIRMDQGILSSLVLLQAIDILYQKHNPQRENRPIRIGEIDFNEKYFQEDVVSACSAIFVHNLPLEAFKASKIDSSDAPFPFY